MLGRGQRAVTWKMADSIKAGPPGTRPTGSGHRVVRMARRAATGGSLRPEGPSILQVIELGPPERPREACPGCSGLGTPGDVEAGLAGDL
ncbi:MAG: hypothetical protein RMK16_05660 [Acidobacteriota bacterium]|nr:hypothetical protein [Acidobacteriota bacterium]